MTRSAVITGVAGQDGVLLARHLLTEGYTVVGTTLPGAPSPLRPYLAGVDVVELDLRDTAALTALLADRRPDELYNLAGLTSVKDSWAHPDLTRAVNADAVERLLDATTSVSPSTKVFQASSSEVFGPDAVNPQNESTPHAPKNPYAESKSVAHQATVRCRDEDGLFASVGILYNHESPLRETSFVTRKISRAAAEIAEGVRDTVTLGNLDVSRDWGAASDFVAAMHASLQQDEPQDYVVATGRLHTIGQLVEAAFSAAGVSDPWSHVEQDEALMRPADAPGLCGDARRARECLGWEASMTFEDLVTQMVQTDLRRIRSGVEESVDYLR
jgi:GDPmannose 4,6-dehydratase